MKKQIKIIVTSLLLTCLLLWGATVFGGVAASISHLSGPLMAQKADGSTRALQVGSSVDEGDTVITQKRTYARLKFTDGSEVTLKPDSQFRVEQHNYDKADPKADAGSYRLIKGGLRTITGQIGKRGNHDSYQMKTPTATIGIRGTIFDVTYCTGGDSCGAVRPGLYLAVNDGFVVITNNEGVSTTLQVKAGEYVYVENATTPPVVLSTRPDIPYDPPPALSQTGAAGQEGGGGQQGAGTQTDCIMR
jgi:hypothetical protein